MRSFIALLVFALALWRAVIDWLSTVTQGEAWSFVPVRGVWQSWFPSGPQTFETLVTGYLGDRIWRYLDRVLDFPMVSLLLFIGAFLWMFRRPAGVERRSVFKR